MCRLRSDVGDKKEAAFGKGMYADDDDEGRESAEAESMHAAVLAAAIDCRAAACAEA
jgi:hypothetical protein